MWRMRYAVWSGIVFMALALTFALLLFGRAKACGAGAPMQQEWFTEYLTMVNAEDAHKVNQGVDGILRDRGLLVEQLIPLIDPANATTYRDETRCAAAFLLGEERAVEAVPVLSKALADEPGRKDSSRINRFDAPVLAALVKIGRPAVPVMISIIETSDREEQWHNSVAVLERVIGGRGHVIELLDKLKARDGGDDAKRSRIMRAAKWTEEHGRGTEEPLY